VEQRPMIMMEAEGGKFVNDASAMVGEYKTTAE
jgi:hypothetical protein